ncbi:hypothetical protein [Rickettsia endosymbiont of Nabis limbatus]|uniref:hypothetical protein n=1 Tax=Rickettsia endosymbiont of Nabis limbatus TaxID=3066268 RepID=UPI003AF38591
MAGYFLAMLDSASLKLYTVLTCLRKKFVEFLNTDNYGVDFHNLLMIHDDYNNQK